MPAFVAALLLSHRFPSPHSKLCRRRRAVTASASPVVIGLNEYSHDTSIALIEERSGELVFAASKERLTRHKHHGEDPTILIPHALSAIRSPSESLEDVCKRVHLVVANNHHFRIAPFEKRLPFQIHMRYVPPTYASKWNLIGAHLSKNEVAPNAHKIEVSHHLAHAFSAIHSAPFDRGLVLIMDGMGDSLDDWLQAQANVDAGYHTELTSAFVSDHVDFVQFPEDVMTRPGISFREAETAYTFERDGSVVKLSRVYKRWTPENAPSELDNHSFEDMYSAGALYSRVSAILFGDWNACGKVCLSLL